MLDADVWSGMEEITSRMFLDKAKPNEGLLCEALSFDAAKLSEIPEDKLRMFLVVLAQYLISLRYEENTIMAVHCAWEKALENRLYIIINDEKFSREKGKTLTEKRQRALNSDPEAQGIYKQYTISEGKLNMIKRMYDPVDQYINTLKKEIEARRTDKNFSR